MWWREYPPLNWKGLLNNITSYPDATEGIEDQLEPDRIEDDCDSAMSLSDINSTVEERKRAGEFKGPYNGFVPDNWPSNKTVAR